MMKQTESPFLDEAFFNEATSEYCSDESASIENREDNILYESYDDDEWLTDAGYEEVSFESHENEWDNPPVHQKEIVQERQLGVFADGYGELEDSPEEEVVVGTMRLKAVKMPSAEPPCHPDSPTSVNPSGTHIASDSRSSRVPDYRPGAGRIRRKLSKPYVQWVQRSLNLILGSALTVDGIFGRRTTIALRDFQRRSGIDIDGKIGPQTEAALRRWTRSDPPQREVALENLAAPVLIAGAGLALNFVKFGFDTIGKLAAGDIKFYSPSQAAGIRVTNVPNHFLLRQKNRSLLLTNFIEKSPVGIEQVNIKLRCKVIYDGLNLDVRFSFDPEGRRSRLGRDTVIRIGAPMSIETKQAPVEWLRCGVPDYRVLRIPISFRIDRPWPLDNYNENFELVLSTMYGFGATANGRDRAHIHDQRVAWN